MPGDREPHAAEPASPPPRERVFNVPGVVLALSAVLALIHLAVAFLLGTGQTNELILWTAFSPLRYVASSPGDPLTGWGPRIWTFVTYAFLHVNLNHLVFNLLWLVAFGAPVARRFGATRFLVFYAVTAAAGALAYLIVRWGTPALMIGASASVSGAMGAAMRFVFQRGGPLGMIGRADDESFRVPAAPLTAVFRDGRVLAFLAVWFGVNLLFGLGAISMPGMQGAAIAWEAHIGGLLAGLLGFSLFDRTSSPAQPAAPQDTDRPPTAGDDPTARP
jgi:membrane associated rhomboid family serine protease